MRSKGSSSAACSAPSQRGSSWALTKGNVRAVSCPTHFPAASLGLFPQFYPRGSCDGSSACPSVVFGCLVAGGHDSSVCEIKHTHAVIFTTAGRNRLEAFKGCGTQTQLQGFSDTFPICGASAAQTLSTAVSTTMGASPNLSYRHGTQHLYGLSTQICDDIIETTDILC